jgi:hypothetical protein
MVENMKDNGRTVISMARVNTKVRMVYGSRVIGSQVRD